MEDGTAVTGRRECAQHRLISGRKIPSSVGAGNTDRRSAGHVTRTRLSLDMQQEQQAGGQIDCEPTEPSGGGAEPAGTVKTPGSIHVGLETLLNKMCIRDRT